MRAVIGWAFNADRMGSSDCEVLGDGWLAQPVNSLTSLAFVAIGLAVVVATRYRSVDVVRTGVYGACVAAIGLGSVLYHGPQPTGSQLAHDLPILLTVWFVIVQDARALTGRPQRDLGCFAAGAAIATAMAIVAIGTIPTLTAVSIAVVVLLETFIARRGRRPRDRRRSHLTTFVPFGVGAVAVAAWVSGRTDSPLCDPDSALQLHGLWHLLSAMLLGLWWWLAFWRRGDEGAHHGALVRASDR